MPPRAQTRSEARPAAIEETANRLRLAPPRPKEPWLGIPAAIATTAASGGTKVDVDRVMRRFESAVRDFHKRRQERDRLPIKTRRNRLRALAFALGRLEAQFVRIGREESSGRVRADESILEELRAAWPILSGVAIPVKGEDGPPIDAVYPREHPFTLEDWFQTLVRVRGQVESARLTALFPAKRGQRRDDAVHRLLLDVALILGSEGLLRPTGGYLFRACAHAVMVAAGRRLPRGKAQRRKLRRIARIALHILGKGDLNSPRRG